MRIIKRTDYDFLGKRHAALAFSGLAMLATVILFLIRGLNWGIDFRGGSEIQLRFDQPVEASVVRKAMDQLGFDKASVQEFGEPEDNEYLVRVERMSVLSEAEHQKLADAIHREVGENIRVAPYDPDAGDAIELTAGQQLEPERLRRVVEDAGLQVNEVRGSGRGDRFQYTVILEGVSTRLQQQLNQVLAAQKNGEAPTVELRRVEYVGPQVGKQLRTRGFLSLFYAVIGILIYLAVRFDFRFAPGAVAALAHDAFLTVGFYSLTGLEFNLTSVAAVLTVIGYSVNDTVIIYDRIRENLDRYAGRSLYDLINQSVNETLSRTLLTSGTTLLALAGLWIFAQGTIWDFAVAMSWGIFIGTYSTIFIASPMVLWIDRIIRKRTAKESAAPGPRKKAGTRAA